MANPNEFELVNKYYDAELTKEEEAYLFSLLSSNDKAREYFKTLGLIQEAVQQTAEDVPFELEEKIFNSISSSRYNGILSIFKLNVPSVIAYAVTVFLIILTFFFYTELNYYRAELSREIKTVNKQTQMIELLFNSMPTTIVNTKLDNEIVITPTM